LLTLDFPWPKNTNDEFISEDMEGQMKILGILGSSRKNGNTEILLDLALEEAEKNGLDICKMPLRGKSIAPCNGCEKCVKTGKCVIKDDMQDIYKEMLDSDGIIWATPVYFWSMSGQTKTVMDRTYALGFPRLQLMNKVGGLISVAATRGCVNTANIFHMYFSYNHMFFAEFASGYARAKGEIQKIAYPVNAAKEMVHQMIGLIEGNLKYPQDFHSPLIRFVREKYRL
jgi:multimeric flavodoxin WrbA